VSDHAAALGGAPRLPRDFHGDYDGLSGVVRIYLTYNMRTRNDGSLSLSHTLSLDYLSTKTGGSDWNQSQQENLSNELTDRSDESGWTATNATGACTLTLGLFSTTG